MQKSASDSTSDSDSSAHDEIDENTIRAKRSIDWCGVEDEEPSISTPNITWPPTTPNWRQLRPVRPGNPKFGTRMQLYSKTHQHLAVYPDNTIKGTADEEDLHTLLDVISAGHPGHVKIKGLLSNIYVSMDQNGRLYGESDPTNDGNVFIEHFQGLKKSGKFKRGPKTAYGQKAISFLPRRGRFQ